VLFVDAAHFVYGSFLGYVWCLVRLFVPTGSGRQRLSVLGALDAITHELFTVTTCGTVNAETVCTLLRQIAAHVHGPITLVLDNARYQHCSLVTDLARSLGIHLLYLPPYSPNLNLIERLWKYLKARSLASRSHADFAAMQAAVHSCILEIQQGTHDQALDTLLTLNFQTFDEVPTVAA
jgi:transposase